MIADKRPTIFPDIPDTCSLLRKGVDGHDPALPGSRPAPAGSPAHRFSGDPDDQENMVRYISSAARTRPFMVHDRSASRPFPSFRKTGFSVASAFSTDGVRRIIATRENCSDASRAASIPV